MSMMCSKSGCTVKKGMCVHEKVMMAMMTLIALGAVGHWVFHWF